MVLSITIKCLLTVEVKSITYSLSVYGIGKQKREYHTLTGGMKTEEIENGGTLWCYS